MKLRTIARYLDSDSFMLECKGELASYEGKDAVEDMLRHFGDADVIRITPNQACFDIDIK